MNILIGIIKIYAHYLLFFLLILSPAFPGFGQILNVSTPDILNMENSELPDNRVNTIFFDALNTAWIGTNSGLTQIFGENWFHYTTDDVLPENTVNVITGELSSSKNILYLGTNNGFTRAEYLDDQKIDSHTTYQTTNSELLSDSVTAIEIDPDGNKWIATNKGINLFNTDFVTSVTEAISSNLDLFSFIQNIITGLKWYNPLQQILVSTRGAGIARLRYNDVDGISSATAFDTYWTDIISDTISSIAIDEVQQWYGTDMGLQKHSDSMSLKGWGQYFNTDSGLISNVITALHFDSNNNLWIGSDQGLSILSGDSLYQINSENGIVNNVINCISEDQEGIVWIGTDFGIERIRTENLINSRNLPDKNLSCSDIKLYPNPANNYLYILLPEKDLKHRVEVQIYNLNASLVYQSLYTPSPGGLIKLNIQNVGLDTGLWLIKIKQNKILYSSLLFVK